MMGKSIKEMKDGEVGSGRSSAGRAEGRLLDAGKEQQDAEGQTEEADWL